MSKMSKLRKRLDFLDEKLNEMNNCTSIEVGRIRIQLISERIDILKQLYTSSEKSLQFYTWTIWALLIVFIAVMLVSF